MAEGTKWSIVLAYNYGNSRSLFCAALVYSRAQHPPALDQSRRTTSQQQADFAMLVLSRVL